MTLDHVSGPGNTKIALAKALQYHGTGFVLFSNDARCSKTGGWPYYATKALVKKEWETRPDRELHNGVYRTSSFKLVPVNGTGPDAHKVLVSFWDTYWDVWFSVDNEKIFEVIVG